MQEIELKFLIPQTRLKGLIRQVKVKSSQTTMLAAHYFDTPKKQLAKHGIGLRIRKEGEEWMQTIKAGGDGIAARLEHNATLDNDIVQAMLEIDSLLPDLTIYQDTVIAAPLNGFNLEKLANSLVRQYTTDVERTTRLLTDADKENDTSGQNKANVIEVAYDFGKITHGYDESQAVEIKEIEFELVSGEVAFLFATAKLWCKRYQLCLSTVTKAERGGLVVKQLAHSPAANADLKALAINPDISMPAFIRAVVHNCLLQILPNSSAIIAGSEDIEHLLQLYLGLRRLHTALKVFKKFSDQLNPEWLAILKQTATLLSDYYQLAYLAATIEPHLQQQGAPKVDWRLEVSKIRVKPINAVRANDFQLTLLELIAFTMSAADIEEKATILAIDKLPKVLSKQHKKLLKIEFSNNDLTDKKANTHIKETKSINDKPGKWLQKIQKMLDISEFTAPLYEKKKTKRWLKRLTEAQQSYEHYLDDVQYRQSYQQKYKKQPNALYGVGWFAALSVADAKRSQKRLAKLQKTATFW